MALLAIVIAASLWGVSGVVAKQLLVGADLAPTGLIVLRLGGTAACLGALLAAIDRRALELPRRAWGMAALGGVMMCLLQLFYYLTIRQTNVGTTVFLEYLAPTLLVLWGWSRGTTRFERWSVLAVAAALAGSYLLVGSGGRLQLTPSALLTGLACALCLAAQTLCFEAILVRGVSQLTASTWVVTAATATALVVGDASALWRTPLTTPNVLAVLYLVVGAMVIPLLLMLYALRRLGAARTGIASTLEPVVASIAAALVLGEAMRPPEWAGGLLIVAAIVCMTRAPHAAPA
ncbi:MAG: EamA family transporter [Gemmatimonadales bacterium]|nr:EamA family transporter [Gemmatimonadales bacterium]